MMRAVITIIFILLHLGCTKKQRNPETNYRFEENYTLSHQIKNGDTLSILVHLNDGLHVYGRDEKIGKPLSLTIAEENGWQALGAPNYPQAITKKLDQSRTNTIIEHDFTITQKIKPGVGPGKALLFMHMCTDNACDRPRTHEIILP